MVLPLTYSVNVNLRAAIHGSGSTSVGVQLRQLISQTDSAAKTVNSATRKELMDRIHERHRNEHGRKEVPKTPGGGADTIS